jgi:GDP-L-fucose synthase
MKNTDIVFVAGHKGMVGSAIVRYLDRKGFRNILTAEREALDLKDQLAVNKFFDQHKPAYVVFAAARVGGIQANINHPAEFLRENIIMQDNVIHSGYMNAVNKIIFLGSSCIYPRDCPQPMKEEFLMQGHLEPTNEGYALAKLVGLRMMQYYHKQYGMECLNVMPCNLYGTNDHYDPVNSHVLTALIKKFYDAFIIGEQRVVVWGSGRARREFMHVDDMVEAIFFLNDKWSSGDMINVGTGTDITIRELAELIAREVGYTGRIEWDTSKPDGMPRKCLDISRLKSLGFEHKINLEEGIRKTISEYRKMKDQGVVR